jgi:hypothetical protein
MTELALLGMLAAAAIGCPEITRQFAGVVSCSLHCPASSNIGRPGELIVDIDGDGHLDALALVCPSGSGPPRKSGIPIYLRVFSSAQMDNETPFAPERRVNSVFASPEYSNLLAVIFGSSPKVFRKTDRKALVERAWSLGVVHLEKPQSPLRDWTGEHGDIVPAPRPRGEPVIVRSGQVRDALYWDGVKFRFHPQWEW